MRNLKLEKNGQEVSVATIDIINGKEQTIFGDYDRDLILRAKGAVTLQIQNKFYSIPLQEVRADGEIIEEPNVGFISSINNISGSYNDGYLLFDTTTKTLYFFYGNTPYPLKGSDTISKISGNFVAYDKIQQLKDGERLLAASNIGLYVPDFGSLTTTPYSGEAVFIGDRLSHFAQDGGIWKELYVNAIRGGLIHNNIGIVPPTLDYTKPLKALLSIPVDEPDFYTEGDQLNGLYIGDNSGLKLYSAPDKNIIQSGSEKALLFTTDYGDNNIYIIGNKTSFGTTNQVLYADNYFSRGLSTDTLYLRDSFESEEYNGTLGFRLTAEGRLRVNRISVVDPDTTYTSKGIEVQNFIQDSYLLEDIYEDGGEMFAAFRNTKDLKAGDLLLGMQYNKAKALDKCVQLEITEIISELYAKVIVHLDFSSNSDFELYKVGNISGNETIILNDPKTKSITLAEGVASFSELSLQDLTNVSDASFVEDQNKLPLNPIYTYPKFTKVKTRLGDLTGIIDSLNPSGDGLFSDNSFIKGKAELNYLKLGNQMLFENGIATFADGVIDSYKKYGLGVSTSIPYEVNLKSGMYGILGTSSHSPIADTNGSVLRMQSGTIGHQSEIWISETNLENNTKFYIRNVEGANVGLWSKVYTDTDITSNQIVNWDDAVEYSNIGHLPLVGGTLTGKLTTSASNVTSASINIPHGIEPTSPINGDIWTTLNGIIVKINGTVNQLALVNQWVTLTSSEAELGVDLNDRLINASVLKSAIKYHNNNLIEDEEDITSIITATYIDNRSTVVLLSSYPGNIYDDGTYTYIITAPNKIRRF